MDQVRSTPLRTGVRVFALGALASIVILALALALLAPLTTGRRRSEQISGADLAIDQQSAQFRLTLVRWQIFLEPKLDAYQVGGTFTPAEIAAGSALTTSNTHQAAALEAALRSRGITGPARNLASAMVTYNASVAGFTPIATGDHLTPARFAVIVATERGAFSQVFELVASINQQIAQNFTAVDARFVTGRFALAHTMVAAIAAIMALFALGVGIASALRATRRERAQWGETQRRLYAEELHQALELSTTEDAVYDVVGRALRSSVPMLDVELLIADSSRAHFRRVLTSHDDGAQSEGCGVVSPGDCPAAIRGHTMEFPSSNALSACPYLRDRASGPCSAACIPVSIAGSTVGVMHATGTDGTLPSPADIENIELSARRATERISLLRAFERSETQARTDPLTGLLNRRSLENEVRGLRNDGTAYAVAYGDLDFFKVLNDTHGHEAGDQALRLISRVLRDSVRPADLVSRYGGEEFVIVLPECSMETATAVLERVRERLAFALAAGRVPAFTVSFGLASSAEGLTFDAVVAMADHALLAAKTAGRDRVLLADELV